MANYLSLAPAAFDLVGAVGNDLSFTFTVTEGGSPWVHTAKTVTAPITDQNGNTVGVAAATVATSSGQIVVSLTDAQSTLLGVGTFRWCLQVVSGSDTRTWLGGQLSIRPATYGVPQNATQTVEITSAAGTTIAIAGGVTGQSGAGVAPGGATGQALTKASNDDYDTEWTTPAGGGDLLASANLSDLDDAATARTNLGLGTAATAASTDFDPAGTAASAVSTHAGAVDPHGDRAYAAGLVDDLSGVSNASAARTNLGLGTAATTAATDYATAAQGATADGAVPKSLYDAKGDLLVGTADNTVDRVAVGTDGYVLTADSATAGGVKWAAASGGGSDPLDGNAIIAQRIFVGR